MDEELYLRATNAGGQRLASASLGIGMEGAEERSFTREIEGRLGSTISLAEETVKTLHNIKGSVFGHEPVSGSISGDTQRAVHDCAEGRILDQLSTLSGLVVEARRLAGELNSRL